MSGDPIHPMSGARGDHNWIAHFLACLRLLAFLKMELSSYFKPMSISQIQMQATASQAMIDF